LRSRGAIAIVAYILPAVVCVVWILALGADASTGPAPRPAMRAVFLDIDGVMLPFGSGCDDESGRPGRFPDRCLKALDRVLIETGAEIVLSSTRAHWEPSRTRASFGTLLIQKCTCTASGRLPTGLNQHSREACCWRAG
jgi:hypothetical protein